jgi:hypothetical protein
MPHSTFQPNVNRRIAVPEKCWISCIKVPSRKRASALSNRAIHLSGDENG